MIILKIEQYFKEIIIPLIQYEIFNPNNNEKLDLKECINNNIMLNISIPIFINENNLDKYDPKNIYYTNLCFNNSNEDGTDIPLYDRINEFNNHYSLCPKDCSYLEYDLENKKVICECQIKDGFSFKKEITKEDLTSKLYLRKYLTNFNVFKCYKLLFSIDGWTNNIGNYIILFIIFIYLLLILIFYLIEYKILYGHINNIINLKIHENDKDHGKNFKESINENIKKLFPSYQKFKNNNIKNKLNKSSSESRTESNIIVNKNINLNERNKYQTNKKTIVKTLEYIDYEINIISFDEAIELDKRTYCQYYFSLIKSKHILLSNIFLIKDYNSHIIKISILLFSISLHLIINACFFNDSLLHIIYIKKGNINIIIFFPQIIYSSIISSIIVDIVKRLSLIQKNILEIKNESNKSNLNARVTISLKKIHVKFISFFVLSFITHFIFWFYLSCFCAVYKNTQIFVINKIKLMIHI